MSERTLPFQGLRVILMFGIVAYHIYPTPLFGSGSDLVSFFFVISGFLYRDKLPWNSFVWKKVKGIYPVYWIVLFLSILIAIIRRQYQFNWDILPHLVLLQSWIPVSDMQFTIGYVGASWFLSSLMFCYLISPYCYPAVQKITKVSTFGMIMICYGLICMSIYFRDDYPFGDWMAYFSPIVRAMEYLIGMMLYRIVRNVSYKHLTVKCELLSVILLFIYFYCIKMQVFGGASVVLHAFVLILIFLFHSRVINILLANKFFLWLSKYVMFIYISHQSLTINCFRSRIDSNALLVLLCFGLGVIYGIFYRRVIKY